MSITSTLSIYAMCLTFRPASARIDFKTKYLSSMIHNQDNNNEKSVHNLAYFHKIGLLTVARSIRSDDQGSSDEE